MCYSTVTYPYQSGKANVTLSDPGAVGWGRFDPEDLTIGMPGEMYQGIRGKFGYGVPS